MKFKNWIVGYVPTWVCWSAEMEGLKKSNGLKLKGKRTRIARVYSLVTKKKQNKTHLLSSLAIEPPGLNKSNGVSFSLVLQ